MAPDNTNRQPQHLNNLPHQRPQNQGSGLHRSATGTLKKTPPAYSRAVKPAFPTKRSTHSGPSKPGKKAVQSRPSEEEPDDSREMAASFLQFCATCEKQIIVPNNSLLYCSDKCRRADRHSYSYDHNPPSTPSSRSSFDELRHRDIVPRRSPTTRNSSGYSNHFSSSASPERRESTMPHHRESEAARYLRQFQSGRCALESRARRPHYERSNDSIPTDTSSSAAPSLSHTPTSTSSFTMPFTPLTRPLPPRAHPYSTSAGAREDLVTPLKPTPGHGSLPSYHLKSEPSAAVATTTPAMADGGRFVYEKREPRSLPLAGVEAPSSLKQLFSLDASLARPSGSEQVRKSATES